MKHVFLRSWLKGRISWSVGLLLDALDCRIGIWISFEKIKASEMAQDG